jgi:hypothetical protein
MERPLIRHVRYNFACGFVCCGTIALDMVEGACD